MLNAPEEKIRAMRGSVVSMIFQDPMSALNPVMTVGAQIIRSRARPNWKPVWMR